MIKLFFVLFIGFWLGFAVCALLSANKERKRK